MLNPKLLPVEFSFNPNLMRRISQLVLTHLEQKKQKQKH